MIYDAHLHKKNKESGGFIIGLEGEPIFKETFDNEEVLSLHNPQKQYYSFYYVTKKACIDETICWKYLKYHPRREKYSAEEVINSIKRCNPKAVIIDTLNEPFWVPYDYWNIARRFSNIQFIFAHAGGYLVNDFIKICHFQKNVWIDFALTHSTLGLYGNAEFGLEYVNNAIKYALNSCFKNRILLSSDYPFFEQTEVFNYYSMYIELLNNNFMTLLGLIE